jgi:uncharacterized protein YndB with AHSA1/START domain
MNDPAVAKAPNHPALATSNDTVRLERLLPGPLERVWSYIADAKKRATWFCGGEIEMRVGGRAEMAFDHSRITSEPIPERFAQEAHARFTGTVTRCQPPRLLSYTWPWGEHDTEITFELTPIGDKVKLVVIHSRLPNRKGMVNVAAGWDAHVGLLADLLAGTPPRPFWATHAQLQKTYETTL